MTVGTDLSILRQFLLEHLGLHFTQRQEKDLYRKIEEAAGRFAFTEVSSFVDWLVEQELNNDQVEQLADCLTIGETYFLREKKAYDFLEFDYLPRLIAERRAQNKKQLKLWSAGCASGEEPYTLAILLKRMIPDIKDWDITLLATDINPTFLAKARTGIYSKWSFRKAPAQFVKNNFSEIEEGRYQINASVRQLVTFSFLNLVDDVFPSYETQTNTMDIIFCRNVMIYFSQEGIEQVGNKFYDCVCPTGILITSPVEVSSMQRSKFNLTMEQGCHVFNKEKKTIVRPRSVTIEDEKKEVTGFSTRSVLHKIAQIPSLAKTPQQPIIIQPTREKAEDISYAKALELYQSGHLARAEKMLKKMLSNGEDVDEAVVLLLARICGNNGQLEEAKALCDQLIASQSIDPTAHYLQAVVFAELGQKSEAIRSAENALFLQYDYLLAHYLLGSIRLQDDDQRYSKKHFENLNRLLKHRDDADMVDEIDQLTVEEFKQLIASIRF